MSKLSPDNKQWVLMELNGWCDIWHRSTWLQVFGDTKAEWRCIAESDDETELMALKKLIKAANE
jgi:hypothetical protein